MDVPSQRACKELHKSMKFDSDVAVSPGSAFESLKTMARGRARTICSLQAKFWGEDPKAGCGAQLGQSAPQTVQRSPPLLRGTQQQAQAGLPLSGHFSHGRLGKLGVQLRPSCSCPGETLPALPGETCGGPSSVRGRHLDTDTQ
eukprot:364782-Chlamydomonas_euryale.AAC.4